MKELTGFIAVIFLISLSAGLIHHRRNVTEKENPIEIPDSTMAFESDTTAVQQNRYIIHKQQT